jgi:electron transfer flavoprotein alpha subunit
VAGKVWVFAEADGDKVATATLELLTKAREVGDTVEAIYAGSGNVDAVAAGVGSHGATKLYVIDPGDGLPGQVAATAIAKLAGEQNPDVILFAQTYDGRDAVARLSV